MNLSNQNTVRFIIDFSAIFLFGMVWLGIVTYLYYKKKKTGIYILFLTVFYVYLVKVLDYTLFQFQSLLLLKRFIPGLMLRGQTAHESINLIPLVTLTLKDMNTSLLNVLMLIPFGFGLALISNFRMKKVVALGTLFSVVIELLQLATGVIAKTTFRIVDINDVIFNTAGAAIGYILFVGFSRTFRKRKNSANPLLQYIFERPQLEKNDEIELPSNRRSKFICMFLIAFMLFASLLFKLSKSRTFQFFGGLTSRVDTSEKVIALTFDDAPSPQVDEVLSILNEKKIKATFYEIGWAIEQYPEQARAIVAAGMEVGNHSYSHERFLFKSQSFIANEVQKTNMLIRAAGYEGEITFRPPNGKKLFGLPWYLGKNGIKTIMWDIEPDTYAPENGNKPRFLIDYTLEQTKSGSIILLHPLCEKACLADRQALGKIIDGLQSEGYRFVTVSELLKVAANH